MTRVSDFPELARLSAEEKIQLAEDLWNSAASEAHDLPVPQSHKDELDRRLRRYEANPSDVLTLAELQARTFGIMENNR